jgi:hypothetical protein
VPGILKFFSCDNEQKKPSYIKTPQHRASSPIDTGLGLFGNVAKVAADAEKLQSQIGGLVGSITNVVGQTQSLVAQGAAIPASLTSQISGVSGEFGKILGQFESFSKTVTGSKSSSACNSGPIPSGPPVITVSESFNGGGKPPLETNGIGTTETGSGTGNIGPFLTMEYGVGTGGYLVPIISPISSSLIAFDIANQGSGYSMPPNIEIYDTSGKGKGARAVPNMEPDPLTPGFLRIKSVTILSPGDGYLTGPDGSLGGNGRVWKEVDEGYVQTKEGNYYVVQPFRPIAAKAGDTYYPPDGSPVVLKEDQTITLPLVPVTPPKPETIGIPYNVVLCLDSIEVLDGGFGYNPDDELIITPDNGTVAKLIVNEDGSIKGINIEKGGCGFVDLPEIRTNSPTGFNATFAPVLKATRVPTTPQGVTPQGVTPQGVTPQGVTPQGVTPQPTDKIISVIDCVGKIPPKITFDRVPQ